MGNEKSISHYALIKLLVENSLRDVSPMTWEEFFQFKTLQPQVNLVAQPLGNGVESLEPIEETTAK